MRVFRFEGIDEALDLVPLAGRRALDAAGIKLSLAEWRASPLASRRAIVLLGSAGQVDAEGVRTAVAGAGVSSSAIDAVGDPSPETPPAELSASVAASAWRLLAPVERYALAKVSRGKHPEEVLPRACAEIVPLSTHLDARGAAHMVNVGGKEATSRRAVARGHVSMETATVARLRGQGVPKGDVLGIARIAGIQAAKRTSELIPLCHLIALTRVTIDLSLADDGVAIEAAVEAHDRTGVEMEALIAASVAALTIYDMLKSFDRGMRISVELAAKSGGKTGEWSRK